MNGPFEVTFVLIDQFSPLALSSAVAPLQLANECSGEDLYSVQLASANGERALCANGYSAVVQRGLDPLPDQGMLIVLSGGDVARHTTPDHIDYLRQQDERGVPIGALCSGAYLLARAGLTEGRRLAVSAGTRELVAAQTRGATVSERGFVAEERYITSSDARASLDLMLWLIERRDGRALARTVGDHILSRGVNRVMSGEVSYVPDRGSEGNPYVAEAVRVMSAAPIGDMPRVGKVAAGLGISTRQLERLFRQHLNRSPKRVIDQLRLSRAQELLNDTERSVSAIAGECGFKSLSQFVRAYRREYGHPPGAARG